MAEITETMRSLVGRERTPVSEVEFSSLKVDEATKEEVLAAANSDVDNQGFIHRLAPGMLDGIRRGKGLDDFRKMLRQAEDEIPVCFDAVSTKELLVALMQKTPLHRQGQLISYLARLDSPIPIVTCLAAAVAEDVNHDSSIPSTSTATPGPSVCYFEEAFCTELQNHESHPLFISLGLDSDGPVGKTKLLSRLFPLAEPARHDFVAADDFPASPLHSSSIDVLFDSSESVEAPNRGITLLDVHGPLARNPGFKTAVGAFVSASACTILHVKPSHLQGQPSDELMEMLRWMSSWMSKTATPPELERIVMIIVRDGSAATQDMCDRLSVRITKDGLFPAAHCAVGWVGLPRNFDKAVMDCQKLLMAHVLHKDIRARLLPPPSASILCARLRAGFTDSAFDPTFLKIPNGNIASQFAPLFDRALQRASSSSPSLSLVETICVVTRADNEVHTKRASLTGRRDSRMSHADHHKLAKEQKEWIFTRETALPCDVIPEFAKLVGGGNLNAIEEFARCLHAFKSPFCRKIEPKLAEARRLWREANDQHLTLMSQKASTIEIARLARMVEEYRHAVLELNTELEGYDISIDHLWRELSAIFAGKDESSTGEWLAPAARAHLVDLDVLSYERLREIYQLWCVRGHPIQLLEGTTLRMHQEFIGNILHGIGMHRHASGRKLFVISVIGVQSSGKSTLLNYLFGCGFVTAAGRCTRGMYATYLTTDHSGGIDILVLDTEGLMSIEARDPIFDKQMTLIAMACSHLVLINFKGELNTTVSELLGLCIPVMRDLRLCPVKPRVVFVLRDMTQLDKSTQEVSYEKLHEILSQRLQDLEIREPVSSIVDLKSDSMLLLPVNVTTASAAAVGSERPGQLPSVLFANETLKLRSKIFQWASDAFNGPVPAAFSSVQSWTIHAATVWTSIANYGGLLHFSTVMEAVQYRHLATLFTEIVSQYIDKDFAVQASNLHTQLFESGGKAADILDTFLRHIEMLKSEAEITCKQRLIEQDSFPPALIDDFVHRVEAAVNSSYQSATRRFNDRLQQVFESEDIRNEEQQFVKLLQDQMKQTSQIKMSEANFETLFAQTWDIVQSTSDARFSKSIKPESEIRTNVTAQFMNIYKVEAAHKEDVRRVVYCTLGSSTLETQTISLDEFVQCVDWNVFSELSHRSLTDLVHLRGFSRLDTERVNSQLFQPFLDTPFAEILARNQRLLDTVPFDEAFARSATNDLNAMIRDLEEQLSNKSCSIKKKERTGFINRLHSILRSRVAERLVADQKLRQQQHTQNLSGERVRNHKRFKEILTKATNDGTTAQNVSKEFCDLLRKKIGQVLNDGFRHTLETDLKAFMGTSEQVAAKAYDISFSRQDADAIFEYVTDCNSMVEKRIFTPEFDTRWASAVLKHRTGVVSDLTQIAATAIAAVETWCDAISSAFGDRSDPEVAMLIIPHLAGYLKSYHPSNHALFVSSHRQLGLSSICQKLPNLPRLSRSLDFLALPPSFDILSVSTPGSFASMLKGIVAKGIAAVDLSVAVDKDIAALRKPVRTTLWMSLRGCGEQCPVCAAKCCRAEGSHKHHHADQHLIPALNGIRLHQTHLPWLEPCNTDKCRSRAWMKDGVQIASNLAEFLSKWHADWSPFPAIRPDLDLKLLEQQQAWELVKDRVWMKRYGIPCPKS